MSKRWRTLAFILFVVAVVGGGLVGENLLAVGGEERDDLRLYTELVQTVHEQYGAEVSYRDVVYASIQGMLRELDPHTSFLSPEAYENMRERQQSSFFGLGILVSIRNGQLTVISPLEGTPAWNLGLRAGDVISTIEGEPTDAMTLDDAVGRLKGPKDTQVNIAIVRRGLSEPLALTITRAEIPQTTVRYAYMMNAGTGYIRLTDFSRSTSGEMNDALDSLLNQGMERLVLDLRSNGGGLLDQTVEVANRFVPSESAIVETRGRTRDSKQAFTAAPGANVLDIPLVVLVNNGTASAAEILAGAVQDHDVGMVVGMPTWGKGLVQTVYNLSFGAGIALTTAKYYTPAGRLIQRDYTSYFDYYTHFDNLAAAEGETTPTVALGEPEFATDLGRAVYGGGGITPDVLLDLPDLPSGLQLLYANNAFFNFAVDFASDKQITDTSWHPPATLLTEFKKWLAKEDILDPAGIDEMFDDPEAGKIAQRQVHSDIFNAAFGTEAAHRIMAAGDPQIQKAIELFDEAAALLTSRHELKGKPGRLGAKAALDERSGSLDGDT